MRRAWQLLVEGSTPSSPMVLTSARQLVGGPEVVTVRATAWRDVYRSHAGARGFRMLDRVSIGISCATGWSAVAGGLESWALAEAHLLAARILELDAELRADGSAPIGAPRVLGGRARTADGAPLVHLEVTAGADDRDALPTLAVHAFGPGVAPATWGLK